MNNHLPPSMFFGKRKWIKPQKVYSLDNFDTTVVLPYYKKYEEFRTSLKTNAKYFQRNGIEVLLVMDDPSEKEVLLKLIMEYPLINWKVIVNNRKHSWRNPACALNVGIRNASKNNILIISPESEFYTDMIFIMKIKQDWHRDCFITGYVGFTWDVEDSDLDGVELKNYGSIYIKKRYLVEIRGYDENITRWGGDDDNIRTRLSRLGLVEIKLENAVLIHHDKDATAYIDRDKKMNDLYKKYKTEEYRNIYKTPALVRNSKNWGKDFNTVLYDWNNNRFAKKLCMEYASKFCKYDMGPAAVFRKTHKIIALVQAYNEEASIKEFLNHLNEYCDGIILLDDGSTDKTYELADSNKLLLKVKIHNTGFNDLKTRNILLDLASFFRSKWLFFMDVDERFDKKYNDIYAVTEMNNVDVVSFWMVHLWDKDILYNAEYPYSREGVQNKWRMFRNTGRMQINASQRLHFVQIPYRQNILFSKILLRHYGMLNRKDRLIKYKRYSLQDINDDQDSYKHMIKQKVLLRKVKELKLDNILKKEIK